MLVSTEIPADVVAAAVEEATAAGVLCVLNPAPVLPVVADLLRLGPILTPNETELRDLLSLLGADSTGSAVDDASQIASRSHQSVIVTQRCRRGAGGRARPDGITQVHAPRVDVRDTTGAGDTFNGVLAARLAGGDDLDAAVPYAVAAAALSVTEVGARGGMPTSRRDRGRCPQGSVGTAGRAQTVEDVETQGREATVGEEERLHHQHHRDREGAGPRPHQHCRKHPAEQVPTGSTGHRES